VNHTGSGCDVRAVGIPPRCSPIAALPRRAAVTIEEVSCVAGCLTALGARSMRRPSSRSTNARRGDHDRAKRRPRPLTSTGESRRMRRRVDTRTAQTVHLVVPGYARAFRPPLEG